MQWGQTAQRNPGNKEFAGGPPDLTYRPKKLPRLADAANPRSSRGQSTRSLRLHSAKSKIPVDVSPLRAVLFAQITLG